MLKTFSILGFCNRAVKGVKNPWHPDGSLSVSPWLYKKHTTSLYKPVNIDLWLWDFTFCCCFCHLFQRIGFRRNNTNVMNDDDRVRTSLRASDTLKGEAAHRGGDRQTERDVAAVRPSGTTGGGEGIMSCSKVLQHRGEGSELKAIISQTSGELPEASPSHMSECSRVLGECVAARPPAASLSHSSRSFPPWRCFGDGS